ncbi:MAG: glucosyl-3-phosphoglycerate phosphatase [Actinomycetota bacterium]|nr:glucosyl-3-phosphoglycerate phosphatase [Actinomycetota bacterium]
MTVSGRQIVVWRHGSTTWNKERRFQGSSDLPLDEDGVRQAEAAAVTLQKLDPSILVTSDAVRARQTAGPLALRCGLEPVLEPRLREADLGAWEGMTREQVVQSFPDEYAAWRQGTDVRRGGGETNVQVAARAEAAIAELLTVLKEGQTMVVVTHGGTARATLGRLLCLDTASWRHLGTLGHGRWATLTERSFGWRLAEFNARPRPSSHD